MASARRKVVRTIRHEQTGERVDVIFDSKDLQFECRIDGTQFSAKSADDVIAWAQEQLDARAQLHWTAIIMIELAEESKTPLEFIAVGATRNRGRWVSKSGKEDGYDRREMDVFDMAASGCEIRFQRCYIAYSQVSWRVLQWTLHGDDPVANMRASFQTDALPRNFKKDSPLPYVDRGSEMFETRAFDDPQHEVNAVLPYDEETWSALCEVVRVLEAARARLVALVKEPTGLAALGSRLVADALALTDGSAR